MDELTFDGKTYISSKQAAKLTGYTKDYIGQLCRSEKLPSRMVGRNRYVEKEALPEHKRSNGKRSREDEGYEVSITKEAPKVATPTPKNHTAIQNDTPVEPSIPRKKYHTHVIDNALSLRYESDHRPLYPAPQRDTQANIEMKADTGHTMRPRIVRRVVSIGHGQKKDVRIHHEARANLREKKEVVKREHIKKRDPHVISSKQETHVSSKGSIQGNRTLGFLVMAVLVVLLVVAVYGSFVITEVLMYGEGSEGLELKVRAIDFF